MNRLNHQGGPLVFTLFAFLVTMLFSSPVSASTSKEDPPPGGGAPFTDLGTAWDPGVNTSRLFPPQAPGAATWSVVAAGKALHPNADDGNSLHDPDHPAFGLTVDLDLLLPGIGAEAAFIQQAIDEWAAVSAFTNLGNVLDSGADMGAPELPLPGGHVGDIRVAAFEITPTDILAHAFRPQTQGLILGNTGETIGGDIHFDHDLLLESFLWVDDPTDTTDPGDLVPNKFLAMALTTIF